MPQHHAKTKQQATGGACRCGCTCRNFGSDAERKRLLEAGKQLAIDFLIETKGMPGAKVNLNLDIDQTTTVETRLSSHGWLGHKLPDELETDLEQHAFSAAYFAWMSGFFEQTLRKILERQEAARAAAAAVIAEDFQSGVTPQ